MVPYIFFSKNSFSVNNKFRLITVVYKRLDICIEQKILCLYLVHFCEHITNVYATNFKLNTAWNQSGGNHH